MYPDLQRLFELLKQAQRTDLLDFLLVFFVVWGLLNLVRGTRAVQMAFGLAVIAALYRVAVWLELGMMQVLLRSALEYSPVAIIVLFQTELRAALTHIGRTLRRPLLLGDRRAVRASDFDELVLAATAMATRKIGALVVIERTVGLQNHIDTGVKLDAELTYDLLVTIFEPHTLMHDGAVIVRNRRVAAASCFLPLTLNPRLSKELGTRHRAAIGITEDTDAIAVVVSEESGSISFVSRGDITRHVDSGRLRELLREAFEPARPFKDVLPAPRRRRRRRSTSRSGQSTEISPELSREVSSGG